MGIGLLELSSKLEEDLIRSHLVSLKIDKVTFMYLKIT